MNHTPLPAERRYLKSVDQSRPARMKWFHDARFGMFVHWGLYSILGRHEWVMNRERIPLTEYEKLADQWKPRAGSPMKWAKLAKESGMKYIVLTTKHHEGFSLWNSKANPFNAVNHGPRRDLVAEFVQAARHYGLKVGFYYSLMDWHHPDGHACAHDPAARERFTAYTRELVGELMTGYGKIDILWYDVPWPMNSPRGWDSYRLNAMVRKLQPHIIINDRSQLPEDISTPEEHITPAEEGRGWEACMTFNGAWGFVQTPPEDWHSSRKVLEMLRTCAAGGGNLLLNIGPKPDGSIPDEAIERLSRVGKWLKIYGEALYGKKDRLLTMEAIPMGWWTRSGATYYFWCFRWPGRTMAMGGLSEKLKSVRLLPDGKPLAFTQTHDRLVIEGLPEKCPDPINHVAVLKMEFVSPPTQMMGAGCEPVARPHFLDPEWTSPHVADWQVSKLLPPAKNLTEAKIARLPDKRTGWEKAVAEKAGSGLPEGMLYTRKLRGDAPGILHATCKVRVPHAGRWTFFVGHDSGIRVCVDGQCVFTDEKPMPPCIPARSAFDVTLDTGIHEITLTMQNDLAWGAFLCFGIPKNRRKLRGKKIFPIPLS
ncbi:alpha-L-fucosidase [Kamptonema cortianum]|nr:alpha-L-fucosidase [Kamptonema cortianum]MDL5050079.1 alpha-L-fucosidase [Oscillatoria amoena NRMC-F 0135]